MRNKLKPLLFLFFSIFSIYELNAQIVQDATGRPLIPNKYAEIKGEIYFNENWLKGYVKSTDGKKNDDYFLNYDVVADQPVYLLNSEVYTFVDPIVEFCLIDSKGISVVFRNGFKPSSKTTDKSYFEIIYDGNIKFLKKNIKNIIEDREYNSATITKKITTSTLYFLIDHSHNIFEVKRDVKSICAALGKNEILSAYIKENKLDLKKDSDLDKALTFYSSGMKQ